MYIDESITISEAYGLQQSIYYSTAVISHRYCFRSLRDNRCSKMISFLWFQQPFRLSLVDLFCIIRPRDLASFDGPPICDSTQPAHRPQHCGIDNIPILIDRILPHPKPHTLDDGQNTRLLARRRPALKLRGGKQFAFDAEDRLFHAWGLDLGARGGRETAQGPLRCTVGRIDTGGIGGFNVMFADDVDGAFFRGFEVAQRVFGVGEAARETDGEEGRVVVDDVGIREGSEVRGGGWQPCQPEG